ncbi:hypothetical protein B0T24DRAFT_669315 [Lasiosphaeria ovina]|uniref:Uncharacterized protein n=1 Tax=Lasiosphaeria ovina TaxID=92902 RepID=A0AAE0JYV7_9PEZI|nr:hypothetical protein B0T24DRAFT_669315 [Lasiosphaeria ovina]
MPLESQHSALDGHVCKGCLSLKLQWFTAHDDCPGQGNQGTPRGHIQGAAGASSWLPALFVLISLGGGRMRYLAFALASKGMDAQGSPSRVLQSSIQQPTENSETSKPTTDEGPKVAGSHGCAKPIEPHSKQQNTSWPSSACNQPKALDWTALDERRRDTTQQPALGMDADINAPASMGQWTCRTADTHANEAMLTDDMPPKPGPENKDGLLKGYI